MDSRSKISWQLIHPHCWKMLGGYYNKMFTASSLSSLQLILRIYQKNFSLVEIEDLHPTMEMLMDPYTLQNCPSDSAFLAIEVRICFIAQLYQQQSQTQTVKGLASDLLTRVYEFVRPEDQTADSTCVNISPPVSSLAVTAGDNFLLFTSPASTDPQLSINWAAFCHSAGRSEVCAGVKSELGRAEQPSASPPQAPPPLAALPWCNFTPHTTCSSHISSDTASLQPIFLLGSSAGPVTGMTRQPFVSSLPCVAGPVLEMVRWSPQPNMWGCSSISILYTSPVLCTHVLGSTWLSLIINISDTWTSLRK